MHTPTIATLLTPLVVAASATVAVAQGSSQGDGLRWTPHRTAMANRSGTDDTVGTTTTATTSGTGAPRQAAPATAEAPRGGTVEQRTAPAGLTANAPPVPSRAMQSPAAARRADPRPVPASGGFTDAFRRAFDPENPQGILGAAFSRAPQGEVGRPLFADEQRPGQRRAASAAPAVRQAQQTAAVAGARNRAPAAGRGQPGTRIALNADGMPSVLAQAPAASGAPTPAAPLPAPRTSAAPPPAGIPSAAIPDNLPTGPGEIILEESMDGGLPSFEEGQPGGPMYLGEGPDGMPLPDDGFGGMPYDDGMMMSDGMIMGDDSGMIGPGWTGEVHLHVPSPYDDPFACEDGEPCGCLPFYEHDGRICAFLRRFGKPYYGWRWYRDFSASAGVTSFQNPIDLGILGNYGFNEYVNWGMPFWNALGVGWQAGVRGVQADFQSTSVRLSGSPLNNGPRNQVFLTTGFYTRAFEGRGLQGGAVWDYLRDDLYDDVDLSQIRGEVSYVWGFNELGFWAAANSMGRKNIGPVGYAETETIDIYAGFYRLHFGDANELKAWSGGTGDGDFILGSLVRAPMNRSLALEGTFTYLIPQAAKTIPLADGTLQGYSGQAWNLAVNLVWYPACRARRGLASPYRPLFEVADNGSMIRSLDVVR
jgi:hypothetical protein